jgi:hypothetical protein
MDSEQHLQLALRTAKLMKAVAGMIGMTDTGLAKLRMREIGEAAMELDKFIEACE